MRPHGYRRLGLALWLAWLLSTAALAGYEWFTSTTGFFVFHTLPMGATIDVLANEVALPDGRTVKLRHQLGALKPWEVQWNNEPEAAISLVFSWQRLLRLGIVLPLLLWVAVELMAALVMAAIKGFRSRDAA